MFLSPTNDGWTLPYCEVTVPDEVDLMDTDCFNRAVKEQFGINVTMLYALDTIDAENVIKIAVFENHTPEWEPPDKARWIGHEALGNLTIIRPIMKSVLETWFAEATENYAVEPLMPWSKIGWFDEAATWMMDELHRLGINAFSPVEQLRSWYVSAILRVNTSVGYVYFKAVPHVFVREVEIMQLLAE